MSRYNMEARQQAHAFHQQDKERIRQSIEAEHDAGKHSRRRKPGNWPYCPACYKLAEVHERASETMPCHAPGTPCTARALPGTTRCANHPMPR